jgi:hypothetical protein
MGNKVLYKVFWIKSVSKKESIKSLYKTVEKYLPKGSRVRGTGKFTKHKFAFRLFANTLHSLDVGFITLFSGVEVGFQNISYRKVLDLDPT